MKSTTERSRSDVGNSFLSSISTSGIRNLLPRSKSISRSFKNCENSNPNLQFCDPPLSPSLPSKPLSPLSKATCDAPVLQSLDLEEKIEESNSQSEASLESDPAVKVVVRIKPTNGQARQIDSTVKKISPDSLSIRNRKFTFDSILDSNSTQEDVFQTVGIPLVKSALAGYNATILCYGQTGSGKTYTLWGPPSAMVEEPFPSSHHGIVPRIIQLLFSEIQREQQNAEGKLINYQCRCSFLEVYNEQISDLIDPVQRNLEIKDDTKNGLYVENLTEEYVTNYEEATHLLIKGLSNRKVGATSINSKSSRSHVVFNIIIESWCKGTSSKCFSSSKISRVSFVDLAGLDGNKLNDTSRQIAKETKSVKRSLTRLGHLVNALANETNESDGLKYKETCLTHLLQESLGGNAKFTVICNVSTDSSNCSETLRTLRFAQHVRAINNRPVINEISEDDVNDLSDQIRQLKEELIRAKSDISVGPKKGHFRGQNVRESLNHLRVSLNRSLILPRIDNDSDTEINVDENDVKELHQQFNKLHASSDESLRESSDNNDSSHFSSVEETLETAWMSEDEVNGPLEADGEVTSSVENNDTGPSLRKSISISLSRHSPVLLEPTLSESPKIGDSRKSMVVPPTLSSENNVSESSNMQFESVKQSEHIRSSLRSSKVFPAPTDSLAASLQRGLQIIDHHQRNSISNRASVSFSFEHLALKSSTDVDKLNASVQKLAEQTSPDGHTSLLCAACQQKLNDDLKMEKSIVAVVKADNSVAEEDSSNGMAKLREREKRLESICSEQAAKIKQLQIQVEQYKQEREQLEDSKNQIVPVEESKPGESEKDQNKLQCKQPSEVMEEAGEEVKEVQALGDNEKTYFDAREKEALLEEINILKSKLQAYTDKSTERLRSSLLRQSIHLRKSMDLRPVNNEEFEKERKRWTEMESEWISLTDDLRFDIESQRLRAEKAEMDLKQEKKCTEELDDALHRAVLGHARMVEHYTELQEKHNELVTKHQAIMEGIAELKKAMTKTGTKGAKKLAAELSALRAVREREREFLKKENKSLKIQLRDTAEAVHAAGELLVRLREAEHAASSAEEKSNMVEQENEKLKKQIEKVKRKHKMEMVTMKQYLAESRLPQSALQPMYREEDCHNTAVHADDDDQAWRAEFGDIYQDHHY